MHIVSCHKLLFIVSTVQEGFGWYHIYARVYSINVGQASHCSSILVASGLGGGCRLPRFPFITTWLNPPMWLCLVIQYSLLMPTMNSNKSQVFNWLVVVPLEAPCSWILNVSQQCFSFLWWSWCSGIVNIPFLDWDLWFVFVIWICEPTLSPYTPNQDK